MCCTVIPTPKTAATECLPYYRNRCESQFFFFILLDFHSFALENRILGSESLLCTMAKIQLARFVTGAKLHRTASAVRLLLNQFQLRSATFAPIIVICVNTSVNGI